LGLAATFLGPVVATTCVAQIERERERNREKERKKSGGDKKLSLSEEIISKVHCDIQGHPGK